MSSVGAAIFTLLRNCTVLEQFLTGMVLRCALSGPALARIALHPPVRLRGVLPEHLLHCGLALARDVRARNADDVGIRVVLDALALRPVAAERDAILAEDRPELVEPLLVHV